VYETLLLATSEGIVGRKEIRNENPLVRAKQILQEAAFPRIPKEIANLTRARNNPDITHGLPQLYGRLVNVKDIRIEDSREYLPAQLVIVRRQD
jgi:hypothetical protein